VVGVGNDLRCDDAAGPEAVRRLREQRGVHVRVHHGEPVGLLELWRDAGAVVLVDTVRSGAPAGTIHRIDASTEPIPSPLRRTSSHTIGLAEAIRFEAGTEMSEPVSAAIDPLADAVWREAHALLTRQGPGLLA